MRNIFLENSYTKSGREASPRSLYKKLSISLDQQSEMLHSLYLLYVQVEVCQNKSKLKCLTLAFTLYKA